MLDSDETVLEWLCSANLSELVPVFEREQLVDWNLLSRLSIPLLQSLHIPLGVIFRFELAIKEKLPNFRLSASRDGDVKRIASMLFEWVRDSQKNVDRQKAKQRPPWLGTTERTRSNASVGFPPLETPAAVAGKRKEKGKKDLRLGTPPRLRSITGIVTFPESLSPKKERKEIQAPRKLSSAQYPSIDEEILRYEMEQASSFAPAAEIKAEPSKSLPRPRHSEHPSEADPESTVLARQEKSFVMGIEEREKTPKHMVSAPAPSRKGHPKTIDPFAVSHRKLKKSPYIL
ncbi:hypothetical protein HDV03_000700 [Kappamyces sp. JEL0829]|nr:hypothetical protein HDV03_000700 [Kappamyces sp. JEL0829]